MALSAGKDKLRFDDTPPWHMDDTPEARNRALWEQAVMEWLNRTQPSHIAEGVILGYLSGNRELFELAATRMYASEPKQGSKASGFRRIGTVLSRA